MTLQNKVSVSPVKKFYKAVFQIVENSSNESKELNTDNVTAGGLTTADTSGKVQFIKIANAIETSIIGNVSTGSINLEIVPIALL